MRNGEKLDKFSDVALTYTGHNPGLCVQDLIANGAWNVQVIGTMLEEDDAARVLDAPLFRESTRDRRVWKFNSQGIYTVRSAYKLCMDVFSNSIHYKVTAD